MSDKVRIKFNGSEPATSVEGLGEFHTGHPRTFEGNQAELAKKLAETNFNFEEVPLTKAQTVAEKKEGNDQ